MLACIAFKQPISQAEVDRLFDADKPAVEALMAFKGFRLVAAMITVSELGDIHRFEHPRQLMAYLGLVSSEYSSGPKQR